MSDKQDPQVNPWHPMKDPVDLKHMGKLLEEVNELGSAAARCVIQGINEHEPVTGKLNKEWLEDEIADVIANSELCINRFDLNRDRITKRAKMKMKKLRIWHEMA